MIHDLVGHALVTLNYKGRFVPRTRISTKKMSQKPRSCPNQEAVPTDLSESRLALGFSLLNSGWKWMSLHIWPLYDHFWPFFRHMYVHLSQNWGSDGHFEVLNRSTFWLLQKLWHKTQIFPFLFILQFCTKTRVCVFSVFCVFAFCVITFVRIKIYNR